MDETVKEKYLLFTEALLGMVYLYYVVNNLKWFLKPLKHREDHRLLLDWFKDKKEDLEDRAKGAARKVCPWLWGAQRDRHKRASRAWARMGQAAVRMRRSAAKKGGGEREEASAGQKGGGVQFDLRPKRH